MKWGRSMQYRELGRTGRKISTISFGAWAIGGLWGHVDERDSMAALHRAVDLGVNFFDTADAYGSEPLLGRLRRERTEPIYIATKCGMQVNPDPRGYTRRNLDAFVERSLKTLGMDTLDLLQLHCPPIAAYNAEVFGSLDDLVKQSKIKFYGVSVERIDEALKAIQFPNVQSVMIVFNIFRQRSIDDFFPEAQRRKVGILARVPLASGLLTGKMKRDTKFSQDDHRSFNRDGAAFDKGETFSGVDYETGLAAVEELRPLVPAGQTMAQFALRWITMFDAVTCAVPGAKNVKQEEDNAAASDLPALPDATLKKIRDIYDRYIRADVHANW
jgi:aryl-alcohol dehydrogenase-like predicted oxidoreductase